MYPAIAKSTTRAIPIRQSCRADPETGKGTAVAAFLTGRLPFLGIAETVEETLASVHGAPARDLAELFDADAEARRLAERTTAPA